mmetsp:Transcript_136267/g.436002  ORF Transcript_136267/g.436002 Transcript_136267/m.436002 type:complete len:286 (-) Transcript_136267:519-1376(-)
MEGLFAAVPVFFFVGLGRVHDADRIRQPRLVANHEPSSHRGALDLTRVPGQGLAGACVPAEPPAVALGEGRILLVVDHKNLLHHILLLGEHVGHQQHLELERVVGTPLAFALALVFSLDLLLDDLLVDRAAVCGDVLGLVVAAVQLWPSLASRDVDGSPGGPLFVLLVVGDHTEGVLNILRGEVLLLRVIVVRQLLERPRGLGYAQVQPHAHQLHRRVTLHEHAQAAEKRLHADMRTRADLDEFQIHADLHNAGSLHALRDHPIQVLLLHPKAPLQDSERGSDAR